MKQLAEKEPVYCKVCGKKLLVREVELFQGYDPYTGVPMTVKGKQYSCPSTDWMVSDQIDRHPHTFIPYVKVKAFYD